MLNIMRVKSHWSISLLVYLNLNHIAYVKMFIWNKLLNKKADWYHAFNGTDSSLKSKYVTDRMPDLLHKFFVKPDLGS